MIMSVQQLIDELSKIENKTQPIKVKVDSDLCVLNDITVNINDGWEDGYSQVELHAVLNYPFDVVHSIDDEEEQEYGAH